jgi:predicted kinase
MSIFKEHGGQVSIEFNFKPYSVIVTCGPSGAGKSFLVKSIVSKIEEYNEKLQDTDTKLTYSVLSSDEMRYALLQESPGSLDKFDVRMSQVSQQAFKLIEEQLKVLMSYPVNRHIILVDSTALRKDWREALIRLCKDNHYSLDLLLFNYKDRKDFYKFASNKFVTTRGIETFYRDVLPNLEKHLYQRVISIPQHVELNSISTDFLIEPQTYKDLNNVGKTTRHLQTFKQLYIVGDVHGCIHTLIKALNYIYQANLTLDNYIIERTEESLQKGIILCGDFIDKGNYSKEVLKLIKANRDLITVVIGNHENFILKGFQTPEIVSKTPRDIIETYFTCLDQYKDDLEFLDLLIEVTSNGSVFVKTPDFICTHSPCEQKYLEKLDPYAKKKQRNWKEPRSVIKEELETSLEFLKREASNTRPLHFFGHITTAKGFKYKNKVGIDSGVYCNSGLTVYEFSNQTKKKSKLFFETEAQDLMNNTFASKRPQLFSLFDTNTVKFTEVSDSATIRRIKNLAKHKVNFVANTIAPSASDEKSLEELSAALNYYKDKKVNQVIIQPKYMGSRCTVYLKDQISDCYMISRGGYKINRVFKDKGSIENFRAFFRRIKHSAKVKALYDKYDIECLILDGELLPWFSLGKGLVNKTYKPLTKLIAKELKILQAESFPMFLKSKMDLLDSLKDSSASNLGERAKETLHTLKSLQGNDLVLDSKEKLTLLKGSCKRFSEQVELFGSAGNLTFKPFAILKIVLRDGTEILPDFAQSYWEISQDPSITYNCQENYGNNLSLKEALLRLKVAAGAANPSNATSDLEGVVVKPILEDVSEVAQKNIAPALKVRTPEFLRLVYGFDYLENPAKYQKLLAKKDVKNKMRLSIEEFNNAQQLLKIPYKDLSVDNDHYKNVLANIIAIEEQEKTLDPRL